MRKTYRISYAADAHDDIRGIYSYIAFALREKGTASKQVNHIRREIASLKTFPERYSVVEWEPWASREIRKMPVDRYVVYYKPDIKEKTVTIIRIFYGGRDVENIVNTGKD